MNSPIRKLSILVFLMLASLLVSTTYVQFVQADWLNERQDNRRTLLSVYSRDRGPILVDGEAIAESEPTGGSLSRIRVYPEAELYSHLTGYFSFIYGAGRGLEQARNAELAGTADALFYRRVVDVITGTEPAGASVELTIDADLQALASQALGDRRGSVVVMDPSTGEILAMVSHPTYDPNRLASHDLSAVEQAWTEMTQDAAQPMTNRAIEGNLYPPGSTFKLVVAAAALESGDYEPDSELEAPLRYTLPGTSTSIPNFGGAACGTDDVATLAESIRTSCNTSFAWLANQLGSDALAEQAEAFGFGERVEIPMSVTPSSYPADIDDAQTALTGIGQHDVRVTPLQVAMFTAAIANDGEMMEPYLIDVVRDQDLDVVSRTDPSVMNDPISAQTAGELTEMMTVVVESGTGQAAAVPGLTIAGKTGTAEYGTSGAAHAWFTGFIADGGRDLVVTVVVESASDDWTGETGGALAAPIARQLFEAGADS